MTARNKTRIVLTLVVVAMLGLTTPSANAGVIYSDRFSDSGDLNGAIPDVTTGGAAWVASAEWNKDGTYSGGSHGNGFLAFTPEAGKVYTLSATLSVTSGRWLALGFTRDNVIDTDFWENGGTAWVLLRDTGVVDSWSGDIGQGGTNPGVGGKETLDTISGSVDLLIVLDTRDAQWTVEWFVDGISKRTFSYTTGNPTDITHVGFGGLATTIGTIDDFLLQIPETKLASVPSPDDGQADVLRDSDLSWTPGISAVAHDVYLGERFEDVNTATVPTAAGLDVNSLDPGHLEFGQTYFWRVDEVNGAPDNTVHKGDVWSFTVEPFAIPVEMITATASSSNADNMGPENTINGIGLDELDQHSTEPTEMWLSGVGDPAPLIQYEFDKAYKLHEMLVWNSNQLVEAFVGIGAKDVVIETSLDGAEWTVLEGATQFAQAPGTADYVANTIVDFGGALARYVKITVNGGYGMLPQYGLSAVRFVYIPTFAREPQPADGDITEAADVVLNWRAGREAAAHEVYLGTDPADLALLATTDTSSFLAEGLDYDQSYYWQVVEINEAETPSAHAGPVWQIITPAYGTVDSFDLYDDDCNRIFFAWEDGWGHNGGEDIEDCDEPASTGNGGGSIVGNASSPFAEQTIVYAGSQSMPLEYDNASGLSEATLVLDGQDWTASGIQTLSLFFRGASDNNGGQLYAKINNTKVSYDVDPVNLSRAIWHPWTIDLSTVGANLSSVSLLTIGVEGAEATGIVYIDEIRLYPVLDPHAALTDHIPVFSATATSSLADLNRKDAFVIDGSGLNADGSHTSAPNGFMWLNNGSSRTPHDLEPEIVFDLGAEYVVDTMLVWNYNEAGDNTKRGIGTADILTAGADGVFSVLIANQAFDAAPGTGDVDFHQTIDLAGAKAQFIKLDISANLGDDKDFVGLSEVKFEGTLSP